MSCVWPDAWKEAVIKDCEEALARGNYQHGSRTSERICRVFQKDPVWSTIITKFGADIENILACKVLALLDYDEMANAITQGDGNDNVTAKLCEWAKSRPELAAEIIAAMYKHLAEAKENQDEAAEANVTYCLRNFFEEDLPKYSYASMDRPKGKPKHNHSTTEFTAD